MAARDDFPVADLVMRDDHREYTADAHQQLNACVYSGHYASLQSAMDDAIAKKRPLLLEPKVHDLAASLVVDNASGLTVLGYGATLRATADMDALIDCRGISFTQWRGLSLSTDAVHVVQNMLYIRSWEGVGSGDLATTQNLFDALHISGRYVTGVRIGTLDSNSQCDTTCFLKLVVNGGGKDDATLWQYGVYCGSATASNNLDHKFYDLQLSSHKTNIIIAGCDAEIWGGDLGHAQIDVWHKTGQKLSVAGVRSEGSLQFLYSVSGAQSAPHTKLSQIQFHAQELPAAGRWIEYSTPGHLTLEHCQCLNVPEGVTAVVYADPPYRLHIEARSVTCPTVLADAFVLDWQKVTVSLAGYGDVNASVIHGALLHDAAGAWYRPSVVDSAFVLEAI